MEVFDASAQGYDGWYVTKMGSFVDRVETDLAFRLFGVEKGMHILDAGCGTGNFSIKLAKVGCRVTGIDVSEAMLKIARSKENTKEYGIQFQKMDMFKLDFPDAHFDGVFSMAAFEFISEQAKALEELLRVVKPGGLVLVGTISRDSSWGQLYLSENFQKNTVFKHAKFTTLEEIKGWKKEKLAALGECLFVPPLSDEGEFTPEREQELAGTTKGGYICAMWRK